MKEYIVCVDCETTGLSPQHDWIIQLAAIKICKSDFKIISEWQSYIKPAGEYVINPQAEVTHGLTKDFIEANGKPLTEIAQSFIDFCDGCDVMGYNSNAFDWRFIYKDFRYSGFEFPFENRKFYDMCLMERRLRPNTLAAVFERYTGMNMEQAGLQAHDAMADVKATAEVLKHQLSTHSLKFDEIDNWDENNLLSPDGSIRRANGSGKEQLIVFATGKYRDLDVYEVMQKDPDYCRWWSQNVATNYTRRMVIDYCKTRKNQTK